MEVEEREGMWVDGTHMLFLWTDFIRSLVVPAAHRILFPRDPTRSYRGEILNDKGLRDCYSQRMRSLLLPISRTNRNPAST